MANRGRRAARVFDHDPQPALDDGLRVGVRTVHPAPVAVVGHAVIVPAVDRPELASGNAHSAAAHGDYDGPTLAEVTTPRSA